MKTKSAFGFLLLIGMIGLGMGSGNGEEGRKLRVVTSFFPLQCHTLALAEGVAEVKQLLRGDAAPHEFEARPREVAELAKADLLIVNGAGLERWLEGVVGKLGGRVRVVDTSRGIRLMKDPKELEWGGGGEGHEHDHGHGHGPHDHGHGHTHGEGANPHIWLDPELAKVQVRNILEALCEADGGNAGVYRNRARQYLAKLDELDREYRRVLRGVRNRNLVTFHAAFPYLAARYGLRYVGYVEKFPEAEPTPQQLAALVAAIRELKIGVIFSEEGYARGVMERLARETGARVSVLDTLEIGQGSAEGYLERMRKNLRRLEEAMGGVGVGGEAAGGN